jgi:glycosyltransferase involved in cell wall biosynthesis
MISFIIPCYNVEDTIEDTVNSIIKQTNPLYEIILVNDGSTDNTQQVLERICEIFPCIKLINKKNGGVSSARNMGLRMATQEYVCFLDGDDVIENNFIQELFSLKADIVIFGFDHEMENLHKRLYIPSLSNDYVKDYLLGNIYICMSSMIVSRKLLFDNGLYFDEGTYYSEDREFIVKCLLHSERNIVVKKVLFHYKNRNNSAMNIHRYTNKHLTSLKAMERVHFMLKDNPIRANAALIQLSLTSLSHYGMYHRWHCNDMKLKKNIENYLSYLDFSIIICFSKYCFFVFIMKCLYKMKLEPIYRMILKKMKIY